MQGGGFYMLFVRWPTYMSTIVEPPVPHALLVNTIAMGLLVVSYPLFVVTDHGAMLPALGAQIVFAVLMAGIFGPGPAAMVEMFPTKRRFSGVAIGYNISLALFGGTAPLVCTWMIARTGDVAAPAYYLIAMAFVSLIAVVSMRVPQGEALR